MPIYRVHTSEDGHTHLEAWPAEAMAYENGPGPFKGLGGAVLGDAKRVALLRIAPGLNPPLHRTNSGLAIVLEGEVLLKVSNGTEVLLHPGDAVRLESLGVGRGGVGGWSPSNPSAEAPALLALVHMPAPGTPGD
jgi:hypothetical protein